MNDIKQVRKRIQSRRYNTGPEEKKSSFSLFRLFYRLVMMAMGICVLVLALLLNQKLNLVKLPAFIEELHLESVASWVPFDRWFSLKDERVSTTPSYSLLKDNQFTNGSNQARSIYDGVIAHIATNDDGLYTISMKQDNNIIVEYGNLKEVSIKENERILKDSTIGTYDGYITMNFVKDNQNVTYDTAVHNAT